MNEKTEAYEVPKEDLPRGIKFRKYYGRIKPEKKNGEAPAILKILPHLEWNYQRG